MGRLQPDWKTQAGVPARHTCTPDWAGRPRLAVGFGGRFQPADGGQADESRGSGAGMTVRYPKNVGNQIRSVRACSQRRLGKEGVDLYAQSLRVAIMEIHDRSRRLDLTVALTLAKAS